MKGFLRHLQAFMTGSCSFLGVDFGCLGGFLGPLGSCRVIWGPSLAVALSPRGGLAPYKRPLEASRGLHDWLLQLSGSGLWGSGGRLGASWELSGNLGAVLGSHGAVLGRCWGRLEAVLGLLGAIFGLSWALLGASSGAPGTPLKLLAASSDTFGTCVRERSEI